MRCVFCPDDIDKKVVIILAPDTMLTMASG